MIQSIPEPLAPELAGALDIGARASERGSIGEEEE